MRTPLLLCAVLLLTAGCADAPPARDAAPRDTPPSPDIFAGLPLLPGSRITAGSNNAAEAVVAVPVAADSVARFYRRVLIAGDWDIRGDATAPDGQVTLHARSAAGRPLWIIVRPAGVDQSHVSVIATATDTSGAGR